MTKIIIPTYNRPAKLAQTLMLTAVGDIKVLKRLYSDATLDIFVRRVKSNQFS